MRKVFFLLMISALIGCATGDRISKLKNGMGEDEAAKIMGKPDQVEERGEYVILRYKDRVISDVSFARGDYQVTLKNGEVVDFGIDYGRGVIRPKLPPEEETCTARLGNIAVVSALFLPEAKIYTPGGWVREGAKGAGKGAHEAVAFTPGVDNPVSFCLTSVIVSCGAFSGCAVGMVRGLKQGVPDDEIEEMKAVISNTIAERNIQETISAHVVETGLELTDCDLDLLNEQGPISPGDEFNYSFLKEDGIDSVLEVSVRNIGFTSGPGRNPDIFFFMLVHARHLRVGDEEDNFSEDFHWRSDRSHKLADYVDNDSRLLQEEIDRSCEEISEKIAKKLLSD
jgi:hypothetical protein